MKNLKIAWRNTMKQRVFAFINIGGLATGVAACVLLFTLIRYELSYDMFRPGYRNIYHVASRVQSSEGITYDEGIPFPAYDALLLTFPQATIAPLFQNYNCQAMVLDPHNVNAPSNRKFIEQTGCFFSDARFFSVFQCHWLTGSPNVLNAPGTAVISRELAEKYFGSWKNAVGGLIRLDNAATLRVEGVIDNVPANTDFPTRLIASYETMKRTPAATSAVTWGYSPDMRNVTSSFQVFMSLPPGMAPSTIDDQLNAFSKLHYIKSNTGTRVSFLRPLSAIHFDTRMASFGDHITSKSTLWTLTLIGLFIVVMACINFINLSTAQAVQRSREMGIRKVLGSDRRQLFWQVMLETSIVVMLSVFAAVFIAYAALPVLNRIGSLPEKPSIFNPVTIGFALLLAVVVTFFAGAYPALVLSRFRAIAVLKNRMTSADIGGISLRRTLVVLQFVISQVLIIGTIVAMSQMRYVKNADLGFNKEAILVLNSNVDSSVNKRQAAFKQRLLAIPGIRSVSFSSDMPSSGSDNSGQFSFDHKPPETFNQFRKFGDADFFRTYGLTFVAGRPYGESDTTRELVVNEKMASKLGFKDPAAILGHQMQLGRDKWFPIVGVVKDFKTNSLREDVKPTVIAPKNIRYYYTGIKLVSANVPRVRAEIEKAWNDFFPEFVYSPTFMDERINNFYSQENQMTLLYKIFAGIAILISCLGLYGLVLFMAAQKTKEVGVRKVLGASVGQIVYLFSKEFTMLIVVAFIVATPLAWLLMNNWLENFTFRVKIGAGVFLLAIAASILIAWITVGYKAVRAALVNPVRSLRSE